MDRQTEMRHRYTDKTELRHMDRQKQETDRQGQDTDSTERCAVAVGASLTMMVQKGVLFQDRKACCFRTERCAVSGAQDDGESP